MFSSLRLAAFAFTSLLFSSSALGLTIPTKRAQLCNGHSELCERKYGNTTFLGSHDSFAFSGNPFALARTQEVDIEAQLTLGVRLLQAQSHMNGKDLHFCHTTCGLFDGGKVEDYLTKVKHFLDRHPNDVLTLIFTNPESVSVSKVWKPIFDKTGFTDMAYVPPQPVMSREDWPTLGEMIESGKRVVIFLDHGADSRTEPDVEFILPQFQMVHLTSFHPSFQILINVLFLSFFLDWQVWEDKYDPTNNKFPSHAPTASRRSPPTPPHCAQYVEDRKPNFVLLDYVNVGQGMAAVDRLNGFSY
ncbi:hypothetical protein NLJ89_g6226 [Agrocybe chaxingu]|uniref:PLC-like phosphodiesterase n=1 Tax=Agrocybe chaxingu TaxID=84603 RepID=A0A9W8K157_9AGAR|nr:hypothetical protein NLJ89_g6226 [Agrocybe chaxingu]